MLHNLGHGCQPVGMWTLAASQKESLYLFLDDYHKGSSDVVSISGSDPAEWPQPQVNMPNLDHALRESRSSDIASHGLLPYMTSVHQRVRFDVASMHTCHGNASGTTFQVLSWSSATQLPSDSSLFHLLCAVRAIDVATHLLETHCSSILNPI